jgi:tetratricopeptide (TPR) repeat protein
MHQYSVRDVEKLVHLPRSRIRSLVEAGLVSPARGPDDDWLFSFQDLIVLRAAEALAAAKVPRKRITSSVKELRRRLPDSMPLSGLSLSAEADRVVVKEGDRSWRAESGQYLLGFESAPAEGSVSPLERQEARTGTSAEEWFERGAELETQDPEAALEAYGHAVAAAPGLLKARINLGCLLHQTGRLEEAERVYREAMRMGHDPVLLYDLGVLLDDMGRKREAMDAYEAALRDDPGFADCHYNLALLCEGLGKPRDAIRHMAAYRRLVDRRSV